MTAFEVSLRLFLELAVIVAACRAVGWLIRPLGQPQVMAEMITGILLGPSLFGLLFPAMHAWLFPPQAKPALYVLAQLGITFYMFLVGLEFDVELMRQRARTTIAVSWSGILTPLALGALTALLLQDRYPLFSPGLAGWQAALFMGSALAITAFPVLARIIYDRGLAKTALGTLALAAGAIDDAVAWCLFAVVLAGLTGEPAVAVLAIGGGALYAFSMVRFGRPLLAGLYARAEQADEKEALPLTATLVLLCVTAALTDAIGIHAVFGAFVCGACMPRGPLQKRLETALAPLTTVLLVPTFFVNTGLNTSVGLLNSWTRWGLALLVLLIALLGKLVACAAAARWSGETLRNSLAIGALMNARGLMELILLNIAYERGVITQTLFTMLVLMAVLTTLMAVPLFNRFYQRSP